MIIYVANIRKFYAINLRRTKITHFSTKKFSLRRKIAECPYNFAQVDSDMYRITERLR